MLDCLDSRYHNTAAELRGPLVRRFQSYRKLERLVVGPCGAGSKDLHSLVKNIAETRWLARQEL